MPSHTAADFKIEEEIKNVLNTLTDHVSIIDREHTILWANATAAATFGENLVGRKCYEAYHGNTSPCAPYPCGVTKTLGDGKNNVAEIRATTIQGQEVWFQVHASVFSRDSDGKPFAAIETSRDINQLKQAKDDLQKQKNLLESIFRSAPIGIGLVENRIFRWTNKKLSEMTGYSSDELEHKSARILYQSDDDYEYVGKEKYAQISKYGTGTVETKWRRKDGAIIDVFLSSTPIEAGDPSKGVTFTALDITQLKKNEAEAQRARNEWERSFNAISDIVTIQDDDYRIIKVNDATCRFFDKKKEELLGMRCYELFRGESAPCVSCPIPKTNTDFLSHSSMIEHKNLKRTLTISMS